MEALLLKGIYPSYFDPDTNKWGVWEVTSRLAEFYSGCCPKGSMCTIS